MKSKGDRSVPDYEELGFNKKEKLECFLQWSLISALFAYMFYRSYIAFFLLLPGYYFYQKMRRKDYIDKQKELIGIQFRELMNSLLAGIQAGQSIESAFVNSYGDMQMMFGQEALISRELIYMKKCLHNNQNLEDLLMDFGRRSHHPDIMDFAEVFHVAKRSGGNLPKMIRISVDVISTKMDVKRKITTVVSAKKMEQNIMNVVPFGILLYIGASSPGFFDSLYHNITGICIMTILMGIYVTAYMIALKILKIEV